jgi:ssRNA-specific RNase YbeY (16S rRNA maturation enzyme)
MFDWIKNNIPSVNIPDIKTVGKTLLRTALDKGLDKIIPKDITNSSFISSLNPLKTVSNFEAASAPTQTKKETKKTPVNIDSLTDEQKIARFMKYISDTIQTYTHNIKKNKTGEIIGIDNNSIGGDYAILTSDAVGMSKDNDALNDLSLYLNAELQEWINWKKNAPELAESKRRPTNFSVIQARHDTNIRNVNEKISNLDEEITNVLGNKTTKTKYTEAINAISTTGSNTRLEDYMGEIIVYIDTIKKNSKEKFDKLLEKNAVYDSDDINYKGTFKLSSKTLYALGIIYYAFAFSFGLMVSIYVANDLLYKRPAFRLLGFIMTLLNCLQPNFKGTLILLGFVIYYIKRRITYANGTNPKTLNDRLVFLSLIPCYEVTPDEYKEISSFWKLLNTYTLGEKDSPIYRIIEENKGNYNDAREKCLESTEILQQSLIKSRNI